MTLEWVHNGNKINEQTTEWLQSDFNLDQRLS